MESLLVLFKRKSVDFLIFDRGQYLGKYPMDAKEKCPLVNEKIPLYTRKWVNSGYPKLHIQPNLLYK